MATVAAPKTRRVLLPSLESRAAAEPAGEAGPDDSPIRTWEFWGHRGDQIGFAIWIACFLLMASINILDLIKALVAW